MKTLPRSIVAAGMLSALALGSARADDPADAPKPAPLNYKIEVRCKLGDSPEHVFRLSDADGEFAAEHPSPPILFESNLVRREGDAFVLKYSCAWRQDIKEAPRDPANPKNPKGKGSFSDGSTKGKARIAVGRPVEVFDSARAKVTITLLEIPSLVGEDAAPIEIREAVKVAED
jgi:hypothetical protein